MRSISQYTPNVLTTKKNLSQNMWKMVRNLRMSIACILILYSYLLIFLVSFDQTHPLNSNILFLTNVMYSIRVRVLRCKGSFSQTRLNKPRSNDLLFGAPPPPWFQGCGHANEPVGVLKHILSQTCTLNKQDLI